MSDSATSFDSRTSSCNIQSLESVSADGMLCEEEVLGSPMKFSPSSKLQMNRGQFMNTMNNSFIVSGSKFARPNVSSRGFTGLNSSSWKERGSSGNLGSGKVIEILHLQVDALKIKNLELTNHSNDLVGKLDSYNAKESKYLETISSLKYENENLSSILNRKTRRVKDLDSELRELKIAYKEVVKSHETLNSRLENESSQMKSVEQESKHLRVQYDALLDAQKRYREHYESEISKLRHALDELKTKCDRILVEQTSELTRNGNALDKKLDEYNCGFSKLELLQKQAVDYLNDRYNRIKTSLDLDSWVLLYNQMRRTAIEYAKEMDISMSEEFIQNHGDDGYFVRMLLDDVAPSNPTHENISVDNRKMSPLETNIFLPQSLRIPKNRTSVNKRSSFYGSSLSINKNGEHSATLLLPGVKRTGSVRIISGKTPSDFISDTISTCSTLGNEFSPLPPIQTPTTRHSSTQRQRKA